MVLSVVCVSVNGGCLYRTLALPPSCAGPEPCSLSYSSVGKRMAGIRLKWLVVDVDVCVCVGWEHEQRYGLGGGGYFEMV